MPQILGPAGGERFRLTLNPDGRRHTRENILTMVALACGLVAFVSGFVVSAHLAASWAGLAGFLVGMYSQYVSATTPERAVNIVAIVISFVGVATGVYHGGFIP